MLSISWYDQETKITESIWELRLFPQKNLLNLRHRFHLSHFFVSKNGNTKGTENQRASSSRNTTAVSIKLISASERVSLVTLLFYHWVSEGPRKKKSHMFLLLRAPAYPKAAGKIMHNSQQLSHAVSNSHSCSHGSPPPSALPLLS